MTGIELSDPPAGCRSVTQKDGARVTGPYAGTVNSVPGRIATAVGGELSTHEALAAQAVAKGFDIMLYMTNEAGLIESVWFKPVYQPTGTPQP